VNVFLTAGEEWRKLTMGAKVPYEQRAEEERRKYEQAMKEYNLVSGIYENSGTRGLKIKL